MFSKRMDLIHDHEAYICIIPPIAPWASRNKGTNYEHLPWYAQAWYYLAHANQLDFLTYVH